MKDSMVNFITKEANYFIGSSAFSVCIDNRKIVRCAIIYKHYRSIVGGNHTNHFIYVDGVSKDDLQYCIKDTKSKEYKSELAYRVNISILSLQYVRAVLSSFIVI